MSVDLFTAIEQARARGETPARTATVLGCTLGDVQRVYARMDAACDFDYESHLAAITPGQPCVDCGRPMAPVHHHPIPTGYVGHEGRGLCRGCYSRAKRSRLAQPDPIAVERAMLGDPLARLNLAERRAVVEALTSQGLTAAEIARSVGVTSRTVARHRARARRAVA